MPHLLLYLFHIALAEELFQLFFKGSIFSRRQSVKDSEVRAIHFVIDIKAKDKVDRNPVDDFRWCKTIDLL